VFDAKTAWPSDRRWQINLSPEVDVETVTDIIAKVGKSHERRLQNHINIEEYRFLNVKNVSK
jgi:Na+/phosphate symporter